MPQFDDQSIARIVKSVLFTEGWTRPGGGRDRRRRPSGVGSVQLAKAVEDIEGYDSETGVLGSGSVQPYRRADDNTVEIDGDTVTAYTVTDEVSDGEWVMIAKDHTGTTWIMPFASSATPETLDVVTGIEWNDGKGNIVTSIRTIDVLDIGSLSQDSEPTDTCTP